MLVGELQTGRSFLKEVESLPQVFYLTGSKFFGNFGNKSDTDFFTNYSKEVCQFLIDEFGFVLLSNQQYTSCDIEVVLFNQTENVHVQLVHNAEHKNRVQHKLKEKNLLGTDKRHRQFVWNLALQLVE